MANANELEVAIHIDRELGICISKPMPRGSRILDLKKALAGDDPTGQACPQDFCLALVTSGADDATTMPADDDLITEEMLEFVVRTGEDAAAGAGAAGQPGAEADDAPAEPAPCAEPVPCEYRVMQSTLFKKPGASPDNPKVIKLNRKAGSHVKTTGRTWQGPSGGEWVELDVAAEKPGWLLIEGPGFGVHGPLLEQVEPGAEAPAVLAVFSAISKQVCFEVCVKPSHTVKYVQKLVSARHADHPQLNKIWCVRAGPDDCDHEHFLKTLNPLDSEVKLADEGFRDGDTLSYVVLGKTGEFE